MGVVLCVCEHTLTHRQTLNTAARRELVFYLHWIFVYLLTNYFSVEVVWLTLKLWPEHKLLFLLVRQTKWITDFPYQHCFSVTRKKDLSKSFYRWLYSRPLSWVPCSADLPSLAMICKQASFHHRLFNFSNVLWCLSPESAFPPMAPFLSHTFHSPFHSSNVFWDFSS